MLSALLVHCQANPSVTGAFPLQRANDCRVSMFLFLAWTSFWINCRVVGELWRHSCDVTVHTPHKKRRCVTKCDKSHTQHVINCMAEIFFRHRGYVLISYDVTITSFAHHVFSWGWGWGCSSLMRLEFFEYVMLGSWLCLPCITVDILQALVTFNPWRREQQWNC